MGRTVRFRRRSRWGRPASYAPRPARFRRAPKTWRQAWSETRPLILLIFFAAAAAIHQMAGFYEPPGFLQGEPVEVAGDFTRCGPERGAFCVVDGDTFKLGEVTYRVTGIDTAEVSALCPAEGAQAEASTAALQSWLNAAPFQLATRLDEPADRYGRTLAIVKRVRPDGSEERLAEWMRENGGARGYDGGFRSGWC